MSDDKQLIVYCTSLCADCTRSKALLDRLKVSYTEINIENVEGAAEIVVRLTGGYRSVPTIVFSDNSFLVEPSDIDLQKRLKELGYIY